MGAINGILMGVYAVVHESKYLSIRGILGLCGIGVLHRLYCSLKPRKFSISPSTTTNQCTVRYKGNG